MAKRISYKLPEAFKEDNLGNCIYACYLIAEHNIKRGYTDFHVVRGKMLFTQRNGILHNGFHCFILRNNGDIHDPTFKQFYNYPTEEQPVSDFTYQWINDDLYTPQDFITYYSTGRNALTDNYKKWCFKKTKKGEYFIGAVHQYEVDNPELIPEKFREK